MSYYVNFETMSFLNIGTGNHLISTESSTLILETEEGMAYLVKGNDSNDLKLISLKVLDKSRLWFMEGSLIDVVYGVSI